MTRSEKRRRRYWADPSERLKAINRWRAYKGKPLADDLGEVETRGPRSWLDHG